jgi:predicted TIM-barrel fold metal-dependent hydrolase
VGKVARLDINDAERGQILGSNAAQLLNL